MACACAFLSSADIIAARHARKPFPLLPLPWVPLLLLVFESSIEAEAEGCGRISVDSSVLTLAGEGAAMGAKAMGEGVLDPKLGRPRPEGDGIEPTVAVPVPGARWTIGCTPVWCGKGAVSAASGLGETRWTAASN